MREDFYRRFLLVPLTTILLMFVPKISFTQEIDVDTTMTVEQLVTQVLLGNGVAVSNITFNGMDASQINVQASRFFGSSTLVEFPEAVVLGTMDNYLSIIDGAIFPNPDGGNGFGDPDLVEISGFDINDAAILEFDFIPNGDSLEFRYVFASNEYDGYTCSNFNDVFGFFLSGPGLSGPFLDNAVNIALIPGTDIPVGVNTVNSGSPSGFDDTNCLEANPNYVEDSQYFVQNSALVPDDIQINGMTVTLTAFAEVICGEEYHIKLAIGNAGDQSFDSAVFLEAGSFTSNSVVEVNLEIPVGVNDSTLYEGCGTASLQFIRPLASTGLQEVAYLDITGTAQNGVDFAPEVPDSIIFPPGIDTVNVILTAPFDGLEEGEEVVNITITNIASECSGAELTSNFQFYIREPDPMTVTGFDGALADCSDEIELYPTITGGYGEYGYIWSNGQSSDTITVSPGFTTTYFLTVTDTCGVDPLSTQFNVDVPIYPPVFVDLGDDVLIQTCDVVLPLTPETVSGGFGGYEYQWFVDGEFVTDANPFNYLVEATSEVAIIVNDVCGDTDTDTIAVELPPNEVTAFLPDGYVAETCLDGFLLPVLADGGIGDLTYTWTIDGVEVEETPLSYLEYHPNMGQQVVVRAQDQCQNFAFDSTFVDFDFPEVSFELPGDTSICPETEARLSVAAVEGSGFFNYEWVGFPDSTNNSITVQPELDRNYFVSVVDTCGMRADTVINVAIRRVRADFDFTEIEYYGMIFENYSIGDRLSYFWDFGDGETSFEENPRHFFTGLENYEVVLTAIDAAGCLDTAYIVTDPPTEIFIPSGFSPNGDGINDLFGVYGENITEFKMWIYDRWGDEVFYSEDPKNKWNGSDLNGEFYPGSTSFNYLIEYKGPSEEDATVITGVVHLVR